MSVLVVAALSARMLAEAARDEGFEVVALDLFGDADTRRASLQWRSIGDPHTLRIDGERLLAALREIARTGRAIGWIAGSGFEGRPELLALGAKQLPWLGNPAEAVRRVRDPQAFFEVLDAHRIAHPAVRFTPPADPSGWLLKDAHGCGGLHIRRAAGAAMEAHHYFQREAPGVPMSATFLADGCNARVLGFNRQTVRAVAGRPFAFCGVIGPVPMPPEAAERMTAAVRTLARAFGLCGLGSLDFLLDGAQAQVLEINPRPPASLALYGKPWRPIADHIQACRDGNLPPMPSMPRDGVVGTETVYAEHAMHLDAADVARLAARGDCHDLPVTAARFETGAPVCSVSARGANADQVQARLAAARDAVHRSMKEPA
jgi:uncharacterized protein